MSSSRVFIQNPISRSLLLHLLLALLLVAYFIYAPKFQPAEPLTIDVIDHSSKIAENARKKEEESRNKMIVQKSEGQESKIANKDSYLSDKTRTVKEEKSAARPGEVDHLQVIPSQNLNSSTNSRTAHRAQHAPAKAVKLSDLGMKMTPQDTENYEDQRQWAESQTGEAMRGGQYIKGMKEGETSALNTKEFVFYSYFERVRQQLNQAWQPILQQQIARIFKSGRKLASNSDYTTKTLVTLNAHGDIQRVQVLEQSGTFDLDDAAVQALNKAGPYPNPPKGLIGNDGLVQLQWEFVLRMN
jgi:TonB family protein